MLQVASLWSDSEKTMWDACLTCPYRKGEALFLTAMLYNRAAL